MQSITFHVARIFRSRLPGNKGNSKLSVHTIIKVGVNESYQWAQSALSGRLQDQTLKMNKNNTMVYVEVKQHGQQHQLMTLLCLTLEKAQRCSCAFLDPNSKSQQLQSSIHASSAERASGLTVSQSINWLCCDLQALFPLAFWLHCAVKVRKIH